MATEVNELLQAHQAGDLGKLESCWSEMVQNVPDDTAPLLAILDELVQWGETQRALSMAESLRAPLRDQGRWQELDTLLRRILKLDADADGLGDDFADCYRNVFSDSPSIDLFIDKTRLRFARPVGPALDQMSVLLKYREGDVVLHESGWGVGIVTGYDPTDAMMIVDFEENKGHKFSPAAAPKLVKRLEPTDYRAMLLLDPDGLKRMLKEEPVEVLKNVLRARNGKGTASKIKGMMVPSVIPTKSWTSWWTKARKAATGDAMIRCQGTGATAIFSLRDRPADPVQEATTAFRSTSDPKKRATIALEAARGPHAEAVVPALTQLVRSMPLDDPAVVAESHFLLAAIGDPNPDRLDPASLGDPEMAMTVLTSVRHPQLRVHAYDAIQQAPIDDRIAFLKDAFFRVRPDLFNVIFKDLGTLGDEGKRTQEEIVEQLVLHPRQNADRYGWLVSRAVRGKIESPSLPDPAAMIRKLIDAINHLYRHSNGDADYRDRFNRISATLFEKDGQYLDQVLESCGAGPAHELRDRFGSCLAFTDNMRRELAARVSRKHPVRPRSEEAIEEEAAEAAAAAMMSSDVIWVTEKGLKARRAEYEKLVNDDIPKGQQALNQAASYGDLSENAEWTYALEQQGLMTKKAEQMEQEFNKVRVITADVLQEGRMSIGARGHFTRDGEPVDYTILGPWDVDTDKNVLSYDSPLARQLLSRSVGETFKVELPSQNFELTLERVESGL